MSTILCFTFKETGPYSNPSGFKGFQVPFLSWFRVKDATFQIGLHLL